MPDRRRRRSRPVETTDGPVEDVDGRVGVDAALAFHREGVVGELVNDVQLLEQPTVSGSDRTGSPSPHT
jgi:hypothetical protein